MYANQNKRPLSEAIVDYIVEKGGRFVEENDNGWTLVHVLDKNRCIRKVQTLLKDYKREQDQDERMDQLFCLPTFGLDSIT